MPSNMYVILTILFFFLLLHDFANLADNASHTLLSFGLTLVSRYNVLRSSFSVTCFVLYLRDVSAVIEGPSRLSAGSQGRSDQ